MTTLDAQPVATTRGAPRAGMPIIACALIVGVLVAGLVLSLAMGAVDIPVSEVWSILLGRESTDAYERIVLSARLPRALVAVLAGANLAVAGVILQSVTRNPLADPHLIGVTAGAGVAATITLAALPGVAVMLPVVAFVGALASSVFVYAVSWRPGGGASPVRMILAGVAVNAILGAVIGVLLTAFADRIPAVMFWTAGSFNGSNWSDLRLIAPYSLAGLAIALCLQRSMRVLDLGDDTASAMGVRVERTRLLAFVAASLLAGSAASVAGMVGFVGLVVPHVAKLVLGSNRFVLPVSIVAGAAVLMWSDLLARTVLAPSELPVGVITGLIGGPYFIFLLYRSGWLR